MSKKDKNYKGKHVRPLVIRKPNGDLLPDYTPANKWQPDDAYELLANVIEEMTAEGAMDDPPYLSLEEIVMKALPFSRSTLQTLQKKSDAINEMVERIKGNLNAIINRGALTSKYHPTAAIWRHKQLGEVDRQVVEQEVKEMPMFGRELPPSKEQKSLPESKDSDSDAEEDS